MKRGDKYRDYEGREYEFIAIALPINDVMINTTHLIKFADATHHENTQDMDIFTCSDGATFINSDIPHVIYQSEKDYGTEKVWAIEVNNFFDVVWVDEALMSRFNLIK